MKNLLFRITFSLIFLLSSLIGIQAVDVKDSTVEGYNPPNPYFTMHVSEGYPNPNNWMEVCFDIRLTHINLNHQNDHIHVWDITQEHSEICIGEYCSFTWCYLIRPETTRINCSAKAGKAGGTYFEDGCIITIDPTVGG